MQRLRTHFITQAVTTEEHGNRIRSILFLTVLNGIFSNTEVMVLWRRTYKHISESRVRKDLKISRGLF